MKKLETIMDELKEKLENRYENTSLKEVNDYLYVHFNDNHDNSLVVYGEDCRERFYVTNFKNLNSEKFNIVTQSTDVIESYDIEKIVKLFDECYDKMVKETKDIDDNLRKGLSDSTYKLMFGKEQTIGKKVTTNK